MTDGRVLVTGGAGFIGSHVCEALLRAGYAVRVLDDFSSGSLSNLPPAGASLEIEHGSVCEAIDVERAVRGCAVVVHLAALTSVAASFLDEAHYIAVNLEGTKRVAAAAKQCEARRMLFASSAAVYGDRPGPHSETASFAPTSPYARTKCDAELVLRELSATTSCDALAFRMFNVYGPRQAAAGSYSAAIPGFVARLRNKKSVQIFGDGTQTRDFVHVSDVAAAFVSAISSAHRFGGAAINLGTGLSTSIGVLAKTAARLAHCTTCVEFGPARAGDVHESVAVIARAKELLGFEPRTSLEAGLRDLFARAESPNSLSVQ